MLCNLLKEITEHERQVSVRTLNSRYVPLFTCSPNLTAYNTTCLIQTDLMPDTQLFPSFNTLFSLYPKHIPHRQHSSRGIKVSHKHLSVALRLSRGLILIIFGIAQPHINPKL
jgi:hypothetical protein